MRNIYFKYILLVSVSVIFTSNISFASDQLKWEVLFSLYSGGTNPSYELQNDEVNNFINMVNTKMKKTERIAADDKEKNQGGGYEYQQYETGSGYMGMWAIAKNNSNEVVEAYYISGKYIRIYSEDGQSSKLFKMKDNKLEEYLIQLANEKGATNEREKNTLRRIINKRDNDVK